MDDNGVLTITGGGEIGSSSSTADDQPWASMRDQITEVSIDAKRIGYYLFADCTNLKKVTLTYTGGDAVKIRSNTFKNCTALEEVDMSRVRVSEIGGSAFYECHSLRSIDLSNLTQTTLWNDMFKGCEALTSVVIPEGITEISNAAFRRCLSLESVTLPKTLKRIGGNAFRNCVKLTSIEFPEGLETIDSYAFSMRASSSEANENGKTYTGGLAGTLVIPDSVTTLGASTFQAIDAESIIVGSGVTNYNTDEGPFQQCMSLNSVILREGLTTLGYNMFYHCDNLTRMSVPSTLTDFGNRSVKYCGKNAGWTIYYNGTQEEWDALWKTALDTNTTPSVVTNASMANGDVSAVMGNQVSAVNENDATDVAVGVISTLQNIDTAAEEITSALWTVTADGTTKTFTWQPSGAVTLDSGANIQLGL